MSEALEKLLYVRISESDYDKIKKRSDNCSLAVRTFLKWWLSGQQDGFPSEHNIINKACTSSQTAQKKEALDFLFADLPQDGVWGGG
jgi:hypothetical protein